MSEGRKAADLVTFGCRLNLYESEAMRELAAKAGLSDVVIFNTCSVTAEAERQCRQAIRRARREQPAALIVVTGCAAQISPEKYAAMDEVDFVIGNEAKMKAATWEEVAKTINNCHSRESGSPVFVSEIEKTKRDARLREHDIDFKNYIIHTDIAEAREAPSPFVRGFAGGLTRGFVQVQNGCDHACTYCVIPLGRGPSRSVPLETIVQQTRILLSEGYPEIALTGVDITSYGGDLPGKPSLGQMVGQLLAQVPELKRLRLSSLDPVEIDDELWKLIADEPRLMPHLHLSLQAGDDMVLKRMKRRHTSKAILDFVRKARAARPEIVLGADIIAGFPTETEEMFTNTCRLIEETALTWLHVFPYSARKGTPAAKMPQVPVEVRKARAAAIRQIGEAAVHRHLEELVGQRLEVHVEQPLLARAPSFAEVTLLSPEAVGGVILVEGLRREGERLVAQKVE